MIARIAHWIVHALQREEVIESHSYCYPPLFYCPRCRSYVLIPARHYYHAEPAAI